MGEAIIVRRGGGGSGLSKCSIIVHTDTGSTVGAYSNSSATTFVKAGKEIGTSGSYVISGLNTGTYYVKASKGSFSKISSAVTFSAVGIKEVTISTSLYLIENGAFASGVSFSSVTRTSHGSMTARSGYIEHKASSANLWDGRAYRIDVTSYTKMSVDWKLTNAELSATALAAFRTINVSDDYTSIHNNIAAETSASKNGSRITTTLSLSSFTGNQYVGVFLYGSSYAATAQIYNMWLE